MAKKTVDKKGIGLLVTGFIIVMVGRVILVDSVVVVGAGISMVGGLSIAINHLLK